MGAGAAAPPRGTRRQLSLYVPADVAAPLEAVRRRVDPVQSARIPAHVTLCREDELTPHTLSTLAGLVAREALAALTLRFGAPASFCGHGILLDAVEGVAEYQALRARVLGRTDLRAPQPHLTLAHPRNPRAPGDTLAIAAQLPAGLRITFDTLRLIEQAEGGPWRVLQVFALRG